MLGRRDNYVELDFVKKCFCLTPYYNNILTFSIVSTSLVVFASAMEILVYFVYNNKVCLLFAFIDFLRSVYIVCSFIQEGR